MNNEQLFASSKLKDSTVKTLFFGELTNRFQALEDMPKDDIKTLCDHVQKAFFNPTKDELGYK